MKKYNCFSCFVVIVMALIGVSLTACGDDDDKGLSGLYYYQMTPTGDRAAFNFVNGNTVDVYYGVTRNFNDSYHGERVQSFPLRSGWYYWSGNKHTYSYRIIGDIVFIGSDMVMTISGNNLIYDDMDVVLYKWN